MKWTVAIAPRIPTPFPPKSLGMRLTLPLNGSRYKAKTASGFRKYSSQKYSFRIVQCSLTSNMMLKPDAVLLTNCTCKSTYPTCMMKHSKGQPTWLFFFMHEIVVLVFWLLAISLVPKWLCISILSSLPFIGDTWFIVDMWQWQNLLHYQTVKLLNHVSWLASLPASIPCEYEAWEWGCRIVNLNHCHIL